MSMLIFGGYVLTGGILEDKKTGEHKPWKGAQIMLAECSENSMPMKAMVHKGLYTDNLVSQLRSLQIGQPVVLDWSISFSEPRISSVRPDPRFSAKGNK